MSAAAALVATLLLEAATLATLRAWPASIVAHLACYVTAGLAWVALFVLSKRLSSTTIRVGIVAAIALHAWALTRAPAESDDVYRYLWDGHVQQAGINPYRWAPDDPHLASLRAPLLDHVNNRHLPTIYPPAAQLAFGVAARLPMPPLAAWKACVALADGAVAVALGPVGAVLWLASPLVLVEVGVDAHVDAIGVAFLCLALVAVRRRWIAGSLLGLATATKLLPIYLVAGARDRRVVLGALLAIAIVAMPFAGARLDGSLGEFGRRWRSNDGAFTVLELGARALVSAAGKRLPTDETRLGPITRVVTGRDRDEAYPDELAAAIARVASFLIFVAVIVKLARREPLEERLLRLAEDGVGAFLLLTPALHPWYALWLLPSIIVQRRGRAAWLWLLAMVPLGHAPLVTYVRGAPWHDPAWTRLVEHAPALALLGVAFLRSRTSCKLAVE